MQTTEILDGKSLVPEHTLLESGGIPLGALAEFATREGRRPRSIYQIHKWFARRLPTVFRSVLTAASLPTDGDFWKTYYAGADIAQWSILDPFVGGGTSVVEASRLGAAVTGVDVDPIACEITRAELAVRDMPDLTEVLAQLAQTVSGNIERFYRIAPVDGKPFTVLHYFWVQVVTCPDCGTVADAHANYTLGSESEDAWGFCSACGEVGRFSRSSNTLHCVACGDTTNTDEGPVVRGVFKCPTCSKNHDLIELGRLTNRPPTWKLFAVEAYPSDSKRHPVPIKDRIFLKADDEVLRNYQDAECELQRLLGSPNFQLPNQAIPVENRTDTRLAAYGYKNWNDLFNSRQLLHLGHLANAIDSLAADVKPFVALAFSNHLTTNCMMASYTTKWRRLTPLFSIRGFRHLTRPVELNPWTSGTGRGSFPNAIRQVQQAAKCAREPKEPKWGGDFQKVTDRVPSTPPKIINGNACALVQIPANSIDLVLSDPPYFDNVAYSELSEFFQPWLHRLGVTENRPTTITGSLIAKRNNTENAKSFAQKLGTAFSEVNRILKQDGMLAFTYRHSTPEAWEAMAIALSIGQLQPVQILPIPGEAGTGLHMADGSSLWDALLILRKRPVDKFSGIVSLEAQELAEKHVIKWVDIARMQTHLGFTEADRLNLLRATLVVAALGMFGSLSEGGEPLHDLLKGNAI